MREREESMGEEKVTAQEIKHHTWKVVGLLLDLS